MRRSVAVAVVVLGLVGAVAAYGYYGVNVWRWGCLSQRELERLRTADEVVAAFENRGLELERVPLPRALAGDAPAYRGAELFRHSTPSAGLFVLVCKTRCAVSRYQFERDGGKGQRFRMGFVLGNNVAGWITDGGDRRHAATLQADVGRALSKVDTSVDPESRCYIA